MLVNVFGNTLPAFFSQCIVLKFLSCRYLAFPLRRPCSTVPRYLINLLLLVAETWYYGLDKVQLGDFRHSV